MKVLDAEKMVKEYNNDPKFKALSEFLAAQIGNYEPMQVVEAAILSVFLVAMPGIMKNEELAIAYIDEALQKKE